MGNHVPVGYRGVGIGFGLWAHVRPVTTPDTAAITRQMGFKIYISVMPAVDRYLFCAHGILIDFS